MNNAGTTACGRCTNNFVARKMRNVTNSCKHIVFVSIQELCIDTKNSINRMFPISISSSKTKMSSQFATCKCGNKAQIAEHDDGFYRRTESRNAIDWASSNGHIAVLDWWYKSGLESKWLDGWNSSGNQLKRTDSVSSNSHDAVLDGRESVSDHSLNDSVYSENAKEESSMKEHDSVLDHPPPYEWVLLEKDESSMMDDDHPPSYEWVHSESAKEE